MKANCKSLRLSIIICIICLILTIVFVTLVLNNNCKIFEILLNIFIGIFGSGFVTSLLLIPSYNVSKRQLLEAYWQETLGIIKKISDIQFLFNEYNDEAVIAYINELKNRKWKEEFQKISKEKVILEDEKYKEILIKEFIQNNQDLKKKMSKDGLHQYANERVDKYIEKLRKKVQEIYKQYIELSKESIVGLSFKLGDMEFFSGKKNYEKIYNNLYKPLYDILNKVKEESYHFQLFLDGEGNEAVALEKLLTLQKEIFAVDINENDDYKNYIINNKLFNRMMINLEIFRADMYGIKPEKQELHPVECRTYRKKIG